MSVMIQIRNVPERIHRRLKARAAEEGVSLSDLLLREATRLAETPSRAEVLDRIRRRSEVVPPEPIAAAVRAERSDR
jgi:plasmid stability protein